MKTNKQVCEMLDVIAKYIDPKSMNAICEVEYIPIYLAYSRVITVSIDGSEYQNYCLFKEKPSDIVPVGVIADLLKCAFITKNSRKRC